MLGKHKNYEVLAYVIVSVLMLFHFSLIQTLPPTFRSWRFSIRVICLSWKSCIMLGQHNMLNSGYLYLNLCLYTGYGKIEDPLLISNFCCVLNVVCFLLGNSLVSEFYVPTFRNTLFHLHRRVGMKHKFILHTYPPLKMEQTECSETFAYKIQTPGNCQKKSHNIQSTAKVWN
jgi:hypothetical protein